MLFCQEEFFDQKGYASSTEEMHRSSLRLLESMADSQTLITEEFLRENFNSPQHVSNLSQLVVYAKPFCGDMGHIPRDESFDDDGVILDYLPDPDNVPSEYSTGICIRCVEVIATSHAYSGRPRDLIFDLVKELETYLADMDQTRFQWIKIVEKYDRGRFAELVKDLQTVLPTSCDGHET
jgi:hypothetical protein